MQIVRVKKKKKKYENAFLLNSFGLRCAPLCLFTRIRRNRFRFSSYDGDVDKHSLSHTHTHIQHNQVIRFVECFLYRSIEERRSENNAIYVSVSAYCLFFLFSGYCCLRLHCASAVSAFIDLTIASSVCGHLN